MELSLDKFSPIGIMGIATCNDSGALPIHLAVAKKVTGEVQHFQHGRNVRLVLRAIRSLTIYVFSYI